MWRAFFLAIGICLLILGAEFLIVDNAVLAFPRRQQKSAQGNPFNLQPLQSNQVIREFRPPEWAPWTTLASGAVVTLYSLTLRRAPAGGGSDGGDDDG